MCACRHNEGLFLSIPGLGLRPLPKASRRRFLLVLYLTKKRPSFMLKVPLFEHFDVFEKHLTLNWRLAHSEHLPEMDEPSPKLSWLYFSKHFAGLSNRIQHCVSSNILQYFRVPQSCRAVEHAGIVHGHRKLIKADNLYLESLPGPNVNKM